MRGKDKKIPSTHLPVFYTDSKAYYDYVNAYRNDGQNITFILTFPKIC